MKCFSSVAVAVLMVLAAIPVLSVESGAEADPKNLNRLLRGDYAFSGSATCLVSRGGFNANLTPLGPPAPFPFVVSLSVQGVRTFNGDGTGTATVRSLNLSHPFGLPSSVVSPYTPFFTRGGTSSSKVTVSFTYEVTPDRTFTTETLTASGTTLTGPEAGQTFSIANVPPFAGLISRDHRTLTVHHDVPGVETITFSDGDVHHRVCHRSRMHLELKSERDDD